MPERSEQELVRLKKLETIRAKRYPYPNDVAPVTHSTKALALDVVAPEESKRITIAGRIVQLRHMGKAAFAHILDGEGKIQVYVKKDIIGDASYEEFKEMDIGDIVETSGYVFVTKTGEKSLHVEKIRLLTKGLIPLPEKWHGLSDVEARYRHRYVDLIANPEIRKTFKTRAKIIKEIRAFLDAKDYTEVETPVLHYMAGGAEARPFLTHYNSLHTDMVLRIALELPLKKLVVGGMERVYEIGRVFRNEGFSKKHNPEFTMLEFYQSYATFQDLMNLTEELFVTLANKVCGSLKVPFREHVIDFTPPYPRISMKDSIKTIGGVDASANLETLEGTHAVAKAHKIHLEEPQDWGRCIEALWEELVEPKLINPCFITHHPTSISPLARINVEDPRVTDRFEIFIAGMEAGNAFSELNDPIDQRQRFEDQARKKAAGDEEACDIDEDFLKALEYGLPPTAGEGIGIDRLTMILTNGEGIRDVLFFPQLKPEKSDSAEEGETTPATEKNK